MHKILTFAIALITSTQIFAQNSNNEKNKVDEKYINWYNLDYSKDKIVGVSAEKAYNELLKNKKSKEVVVAVIDGGVDIFHEDLKDVIWVNQDEIPDNNIDDDKNGYVDDIHGWNFIGNSDGKNVNQDNMEATRIYAKYKDKFKNKKIEDIPENEKELFKMYQIALKEYTDEFKKNTEAKANIEIFVKNFDFSQEHLYRYLKKEQFSLEEISNIKSDDETLNKCIDFQKHILKNNINIKEAKDYLEYIKTALDYHLNENFNSREIIGDNYEVFDDMVYGNNDVKGPGAGHGTHVAGIIAAKRNNKIGVNGIADNVKIMVVRTVPDGDERDKDVAKSIIYAVDNGADIINMSFGKSLSPQKKFVDKAIKYAEDKGVLLVHAAGNDSENIDKATNYPTDKYSNGEIAKNWIEVGASSMKKNKKLCGSFSNYGIKNVDLFAPGVNIYSTLPENTYDLRDGTSMACPVATGVAAVVKSYYPHLSALELKDVLLKSAVSYQRKKVYQPFEGHGKAPKIRFKELSSTGAVINLYEAIKLAEKKYKKK